MSRLCAAKRSRLGADSLELVSINSCRDWWALQVGTASDRLRAPCASPDSTLQHYINQLLLLCAGAFTAGDLAKLQGAYGDVVDYVERDATIATTGAAAAEWAAQDAPPFAQPSEDRDLRLHAVESAQAEIRRRRELAEQLNPGWNLDRMDQRTASLDHKYHYNATGISGLVCSGQPPFVVCVQGMALLASL